MRRLALLVTLVVLALAPAAHAVVPEHVIGGTGSKWSSGSLIQQPGTNCSIIGGAYPEIMVSGVGSYGGTSGVPVVGQGYWTALLLAIPGNPCGTGSSGVATDLVLPPHTTIDTSRPIRCFGQGRTQSTFGELTGGTWNFLGSSGDYCPKSATPSFRHSGGWSLGYRPLANGQMFQIFVPVKSTGQLVGASASPPDAFRWMTNSTGVYANPGMSEVWTHVLPSGSGNGSSPFVYFTREAAIPFWVADAPTQPKDLRNRVEFFANFSVAGKAGEVCFEIRHVGGSTPLATCHDDANFDGTVAAGHSLIQILPGANNRGPNGGYVPFAYDPPHEWGKDFRITWSFDPDGPEPPVTKSATFTTLPGPDGDGDGVADAVDSCPGTKGTLANGCLPPLQPDPDGDGVFGGDDRCPETDGKGDLTGCPGGVAPGPQASPPGGSPTAPDGVATTTPQTTAGAALGGGLKLARGARLSRKALSKGVKVPVTCTRDATARLTLRLSKKVARSLGLRTRRALSVGTGSGACRASSGGSVKLKVASRHRRKLGRARRAIPATLQLTLTAGGAKQSFAPTRVNLR